MRARARRAFHGGQRKGRWLAVTAHLAELTSLGPPASACCETSGRGSKAARRDALLQTTRAPMGRTSLGRSAPLPPPSYRTEGCGGQNRIKSHVACPRHAASRPAFQPKCKERSDCLWESPGLVTDMASPTALAAAAAAAAAAAVAPAAVAPSPWSPRGRAAAATAAFASAAARRAPRRRAQRCP